MQAEGLRAGWQAFSLRGDSRREPRALPWAEGCQAFGLKTHHRRTRNDWIRYYTRGSGSVAAPPMSWSFERSVVREMPSISLA